MGKRQVIATRLVAAFGVLLSFTSLHAQPPGPPPGGPDPASLPTPRLPNGKPDLTGSWQPSGGGQRGVAGGMFRRCSPFQSNCMEWTNQSSDFVFMAPSRLDPTDSDITMIYRGGLDGGGGYTELRMVPTDGRKHDPQRALQYTYTGYTVGRWEGDTLVLDSIGFTDETWLGRGGLFHSDQMHVVEKLTRKGNQMLYEVTVDDPEVFVKPWVMNPRTLRISANPAMIAERGSCVDGEREEVSTQIRH